MELSNNKQEIVRRGNKVVCDCGDTVVKAFNNSKPASDVLNEALNLTRVYEAGVKAPKLLEVSELGEGWAMKTVREQGTMLSELMAQNPAKLSEYLSNFVALQLDIQSHSAPLLPRQRDKFARMINTLSNISATTRYDLLMRLDGMKVEEKICHGDFNPTNVLVQEDGNCVVLDWAHATQGTPAADVAMTYMLFSFDDQKLADTYLEMYCDCADLAKQVVYRWLPIVAAAELARGHKAHARGVAA